VNKKKKGVKIIDSIKRGGEKEGEVFDKTENWGKRKHGFVF